MKAVLVVRWSSGRDGDILVREQAVRPVETELGVRCGSYRVEYVPISRAFSPHDYIRDRVARGLELAGIVFPLPSHEVSFDPVFLAESLQGEFQVPIYGYLYDAGEESVAALRFMF